MKNITIEKAFMSNQKEPLPAIELSSIDYENLPRLRLPDLQGTSFLDLSCGDGFYCGYAKFLGAGEVVGMNTSEEALHEARAKHPNVTFIHQDWATPIGQKYDIILMTCADRFFKSQWGLVDQWISALDPDGVLILELPAVADFELKFKEIQTSEGKKEEIFTPSGIASLCSQYAFRTYGIELLPFDAIPSSTLIVQIRRKRLYACLLMMPSAYGKSSVARALFDQSTIYKVDGDSIFSQATQNLSLAPDAVKHLFKGQPLHFNRGAMVHEAVKQKVHLHLVDMLFDQVPHVDCLLDMYFPQEVHQDICRHLEKKGYIPLLMKWGQVGRIPMSTKSLELSALEYRQCDELKSETRKQFLY